MILYMSSYSLWPVLMAKAVLDTVEDSIEAAEQGRAPKYAPPEHRFSDTLAAVVCVCVIGVLCVCE